MKSIGLAVIALFSLDQRRPPTFQEFPRSQTATRWLSPGQNFVCWTWMRPSQISSVSIKKANLGIAGSTRAMRSEKKPVAKNGLVKPPAPTTTGDYSPRVWSVRKISVSGWYAVAGRCRPRIRDTATVSIPTSALPARRRLVFGPVRSSPLGIGGGEIAKPRFGALSVFL